LGCPEAELSILLVDDSRMATLNREYRRKEGPTNVLSFPMREGLHPHVHPEVLGDVVLSTDTAHREAVESGSDLETRLLELLIHGVLHLLGYDHEKGAGEQRRMEEKAEELLSLLSGPGRGKNTAAGANRGTEP